MWAESQQQLRLIQGFLRGDIPIQQTTKTAHFGVVYLSIWKSWSKHFQAVTELSVWTCLQHSSSCAGIRYQCALHVALGELLICLSFGKAGSWR